MLKFKNNLLLLNVFLFIGLVLFLITNNNSIIALENNNSLKMIYNIKTKNINENKKKPIKISYYVNDKNSSLDDMAKNIKKNIQYNKFKK